MSFSQKKSLHKSNSFRRESILKLPGGMALFVGHYRVDSVAQFYSMLNSNDIQVASLVQK